MTKELFSKILFFFFIISFCLAIFFITQKIEVLANNNEESGCTEGDTQNCNDCGEQTCEDGSWGPCKKKAGAGPCCNADGNYKSTSATCKTKERTQYKCDPDDECENEISGREQEKERYCPGDDDSCSGDWGGWDTTDSWKEEQCGSWQKCKNGSWSTTKPECQCAGECLETPKNPSPENGAENVKLPVKFDWNDVEGWGEENGPEFYRIKIENTSKNTVKELLTESEFIIPESCVLKSNDSHAWYVKACCTGSEETCGSKSNWSFSTSLAPELITPADPDWEETQGAENVSIPVFFDWCDVERAQSYYLQIKKNGEIYWPWLIIKEGAILDSLASIGLEALTKNTTYEWDAATCLNENGTKCGSICLDTQKGDECGDFSQQWKFITSEFEINPPNLENPVYDPGPPEKIPAVNLLSSLKWKSVLEARSYRYEIKKEKEIIVNSPTTPPSPLSVPFNELWPFLDFNTIYSWHVKSCWDEAGEHCEIEEEAWSEEWKFKTTGAQPNELNTDTTIIPVKLDWEGIDKALSYKYEVVDVLTDEIAAEGPVVSLIGGTPPSEILVDYPNLKQEKDYSWRVRTCADEESRVCGDWSDSQEFTTFKLESPKNPDPGDGDDFYTYEHYLKWRKVLGAKFYQYKVDYEGTEKIPLTIISTNSAFLPTEQLDLGEYTWYVQACLDKDCNESGGWSGWSFTLVQSTPPAKFGLVPCGRHSDNPETPWNERDPCEFKHIFLLLKNILDLLLWRVGLVVLVLLAMATAVIFYFSMGAPTTMAKVKSILKSAGTGYAIVLLAWIIINLILRILGFTMGAWWMLPF